MVVNSTDTKLAWLRHYRAFAHGIPVDDTIARVISALNPQKMMACFVGWVNAMRQHQGHDLIALDGKTFRRAHEGDAMQAIPSRPGLRPMDWC